MHMQPKSGHSGGPDAPQQAGHHQPGNPFGEASHDAAKNGQDMSIEPAFAMNQQIKNPTEDSTQLEVVYDKKAQIFLEVYCPYLSTCACKAKSPKKHIW